MSIDQDDEQVHPECVIFDIDGTMSDSTHRQHLIGGEGQLWDEFHAAGAWDPIIEHVRMLYAALYVVKMRLVFCTGRPEPFRGMTIKYMQENLKLPFDLLLMRPDGDWRADDVIKEEMLTRIREEFKWNPVLAIEDRQNVANMFLREGVPVLLNARPAK